MRRPTDRRFTFPNIPCIRRILATPPVAVPLGVFVAFLASPSHGDLVGHWRFDERSGTIAADDLGLNDGVLLGDAAFAPGQGVAGGAIELARATNDVVDLGPNFPFVGTQPFAISCWIRFGIPGQVAPEVVPISRHRATVVAGYILAVNSSGGTYGAPGKAWFYQSNFPGAEPVSTTSVNDGAWRHLVAVHNEGGLSTIYVDGAPAEQAKASLPIASIDVPTLVGGLYVGAVPTGYFDGLIDDVQFYDHAIDCRSVQWLFDHPGESLQFSSADLNQDGLVNGADLGLMLGAWGSCVAFRTCDADLDCDGSVSGADLGLLLGAWTG